MNLDLKCFNHEEPEEMVNLHGQGHNLHQSGMYQCLKCKAKIYAQADGCTAHLLAVSKSNVVINMNHESGKKGVEIKVVECTCPNCKDEVRA